jgi:hypothetical protein
VDDKVLSASSTSLLQHIIASLRTEFAMKDMGPVSHFLGIHVQRSATGFKLSQTAYAVELLERAGMVNCKPAPTPADTNPKLSSEDGALIKDASWYRSMAGALQYLTLTRPYADQQVCLHVHAPRDSHTALLKRILRYIKGTTSLGLHIHRMDTLTITVSRSSAGAEYRGVANAMSECSWLRHLLGELHCNVHKATVAYCDNISSVYMARNPVHHRRTKHIELDIHFVREKVALGKLRVLQIPSARQFADIFTKGLPMSLFEEFCSSLCVGETTAATAGGC